MRPSTQKLLESVAAWPQEDQDELAAAARDIEARRKGVYELSDEEWADLQEGIRQADRGEFASDEEIVALLKPRSP